MRFSPTLVRLLALPFCAACYTYTPIEAGAARPGMNVRAKISAAASERLAPLLSTDSRLVAGTVIDASADAFIIEVPIMVQAGVGSSFETLHQRVSLSRSDFVELEGRKLDRTRTGCSSARPWSRQRAP